MTLFEYLSIALSLILSTTAMRLVSGLPHAIRQGRRYWVHLFLLFWNLNAVIATFWITWSFRDVAWNYPLFVLYLADIGALYYLSCALVPENPSSVSSWRDHYYAARVRFFVGLGCWVLLLATNGFLLGVPLFAPVRLVQILLLVVAMVGAASGSQRVHAGIAIVALSSAIVGALTILATPGPLMPE